MREKVEKAVISLLSETQGLWRILSLRDFSDMIGPDADTRSIFKALGSTRQVAVLDSELFPSKSSQIWDKIRNLVATSIVRKKLDPDIELRSSDTGFEFVLLDFPMARIVLADPSNIVNL